MIAQARAEILASTDEDPPPIIDLFAGGGTIPLEAQRLGLRTHALDLNPVAVLINKSLIEIPPKFSGRPPVFPGLADSRVESWEDTSGLAEDVRAYGKWVRDEAERRIGKHYPPAKLSDGSTSNVIAWIWARTMTCPNPACGIEMPLVGSWWLGKKKGKEARIRPVIAPDARHPSGMAVEFEIKHEPEGDSGGDRDGTIGRNGATCVACGSAVALEYVRATSRETGLGSQLMAVVAEGRRQRTYLPADAYQHGAAAVARPDSAPDASIPPQALGFRVQNYGLNSWSDLFSNRQLLCLTTLSDLIIECRERVALDARTSGVPAGERLEAGGADGEAYADAVVTYLGASLSRTLNKLTSLCSWDSSPKMEAVRGLFARQAISMAWDYAEANVFGSSSGNYLENLEWVARALTQLPIDVTGCCSASQEDAASAPTNGALISTDPPYYDNIGYSDLSDFFYVWLRRSLRSVYPELLSTVLVPKAEELVANPYRHGGRDGAKEFFEDGFRRVFAHARAEALTDYPIAVYYAFKQSDAEDDGTASTGWETLLDGMIRSGWAITATWPMRSEMGNRLRSRDSNALASSIVLALRPRPKDASAIDRRGLIAALQAELPIALRRLQQGAIAPVDLPQAAIGPGMAVFSRYAKVIESDGTPMTVRSALARVNEILDQVLNEQEGDFDDATRFAIAWYRQHGYGKGEFGSADNIARARNTSVDTMRHEGILSSAAGKVTLFAPDRLAKDYDVLSDDRVGIWEALHHLIANLDRGGLPAAGDFLRDLSARSDAPVDAELVKELAFLLFSIAERKGWTQDALAFNTVATAWPDIVESARAEPTFGAQEAFDLGQEA